MYGSDTDVAPIGARMPAGGPRQVKFLHATRPRALENDVRQDSWACRRPGLNPTLTRRIPETRAIRAQELPPAPDTVFSPAHHGVSTAIVAALGGGKRVLMTALRLNARAREAMVRLPILLAMALALVAERPSARAACPVFE